MFEDEYHRPKGTVFISCRVVYSLTCLAKKCSFFGNKVAVNLAFAYRFRSTQHGSRRIRIQDSSIHNPSIAQVDYEIFTADRTATYLP